MLRKYASLLLGPAPAAVVDEGGGATAPATAQERPLSKWMTSIGSLDTPDAPPNKEDSNASQNDTGGRPDQPAPGTASAVDADAAAKAKEEKAKAEAGQAAKTAADAKASEKTDKGTDADEIDQEKMPRSTPDWEKYKAKYKGRTADLKAELTANQAKIKEYEAKAAEYETKLKSAPAVDPAIQQEVERLKAENAILNDKITVLDVTQHPKFVAYYEGKSKSSIEKAKRLVGEEKAAQVERILGLPDSDYKTMEIETFVNELSPLQSSRMAVVIDEMENTRLERERDIKDANEHKGKLTTEQEAHARSTATKNKAFMEQAFGQAVKALQDPKEGSPIYQLKEGDDAWNAGVSKRIDTVKTLLMGNSAKPEDIIRGAFQAAAYPDVLRAYQTDKAAWAAEKATLEAQVKELSAAQPGPGGAGGNGAESGDKLPADADPQARSKAFAKSMISAMQGS